MAKSWNNGTIEWLTACWSLSYNLTLLYLRVNDWSIISRNLKCVSYFTNNHIFIKSCSSNSSLWFHCYKNFVEFDKVLNLISCVETSAETVNGQVFKICCVSQSMLRNLALRVMVHLSAIYKWLKKVHVTSILHALSCTAVERHIFLPSFPKDSPELSVIPPIAHLWVDDQVWFNKFLWDFCVLWHNSTIFKSQDDS